MIYDYYKIKIPGDAADTMADLEEMAICEARERARIVAIPCEWQVLKHDGEVGDAEVTFVIRRKRRG